MAPRGHPIVDLGTGGCILVDRFVVPVSAKGAAVVFLSHFHADHLGGLGAWHGGRIYCSAITRHEMVRKHPHLDQCISPLPFHQLQMISVGEIQVSVTLIDAGHSPGSAMFLFEWVHPVDGPRACFCMGDGRPQISRLENLVRGKEIDQLYIDDTFASTKWRLFPQPEAVRSTIIKLVREAREKDPHIHVFFLLYCSGHSFYLPEIHRVFGSRIHVTPQYLEEVTAIWSEREQDSQGGSDLSVTAENAYSLPTRAIDPAIYVDHCRCRAGEDEVEGGSGSGSGSGSGFTSFFHAVTRQEVDEYRTKESATKVFQRGRRDWDRDPYEVMKGLEQEGKRHLIIRTVATSFSETHNSEDYMWMSDGLYVMVNCSFHSSLEDLKKIAALMRPTQVINVNETTGDDDGDDDDDTGTGTDAHAHAKKCVTAAMAEIREAAAGERERERDSLWRTSVGASPVDMGIGIGIGSSGRRSVGATPSGRRSGLGIGRGCGFGFGFGFGNNGPPLASFVYPSIHSGQQSPGFLDFASPSGAGAASPSDGGVIALEGGVASSAGAGAGAGAGAPVAPHAVAVSEPSPISTLNGSESPSLEILTAGGSGADAGSQKRKLGGYGVCIEPPISKHLPADTRTDAESEAAPIPIIPIAAPVVDEAIATLRGLSPMHGFQFAQELFKRAMEYHDKCKKLRKSRF